jgi:hypothetical protein
MIFALLLAREISFAGGTVHDLANTLSAMESKPVAILRGDDVSVPKFAIGRSDETLFRQLLKVRSGYVSGPRWQGFFGASYPDYMLRTSFRIGPEGALAQLGNDTPEVHVFHNGDILVKQGSKGGSFVSELARTAFPGKWTVHWRYQRAVIAFSAGRMSKMQFVEAMSEALGAKLVEEKGLSKLQFDAAKFKPRFLAWFDRKIAEESKLNPGSFKLLDYQFARDAVNSAPMNVFARAFDSPGRAAEYEVKPNTPMARWVLRRMGAWSNRTDVANVSQSGQRSLMNTIDLDRPISIRINGANAKVSISAYLKGQENHKIAF